MGELTTTLVFSQLYIEKHRVMELGVRNDPRWQMAGFFGALTLDFPFDPGHLDTDGDFFFSSLAETLCFSAKSEE